MSLYICMDIGSTDLKYGLIDEAGRILLKQSRPSEAGQGGPRLMEVVKEAAVEMISRAEQRPEGICLSTSGMVDCEKGSILYAYAGQIPEYTGMPVKSIMEEAFHIPCEIENDVKCAALGEYYQGEAAGDCFMMTIVLYPPWRGGAWGRRQRGRGRLYGGKRQKISGSGFRQRFVQKSSGAKRNLFHYRIRGLRPGEGGRCHLPGGDRCVVRGAGVRYRDPLLCVKSGPYRPGRRHHGAGENASAPDRTGPGPEAASGRVWIDQTLLCQNKK